jgi:hypothetical protein
MARRYDHEVKGLSRSSSPGSASASDVPATATVMRVRHRPARGHRPRPRAIHPYYSDIDAEAMAHRLPRRGRFAASSAPAPAIDRLSRARQFLLARSRSRARSTPDGEHKLAQLVRCCEGLRAACEAYGVPLISGKDSMKNDAFLGGVKISIPPTLLCLRSWARSPTCAAPSTSPRSPPAIRIYVLGPVARRARRLRARARLLGLTLDRCTPHRPGRGGREVPGPGRGA